MKLVFLIKVVHNQFVILKDYCGIKQGVSYDLFPLIWNPFIYSHYLIILQAMKSQLEWGKLKFYKKGGVRKRKTGINRRRVFKIALEGGREWKFCLEELRLFNTFFMRRAKFSKH